MVAVAATTRARPALADTGIASKLAPTGDPDRGVKPLLRFQRATLAVPALETDGGFAGAVTLTGSAARRSFWAFAHTLA